MITEITVTAFGHDANGEEHTATQAVTFMGVDPRGIEYSQRDATAKAVEQLISQGVAVERIDAHAETITPFFGDDDGGDDDLRQAVKTVTERWKAFGRMEAQHEAGHVSIGALRVAHEEALQAQFDLLELIGVEDEGCI